jgi:hypothetical protein
MAYQLRSMCAQVLVLSRPQKQAILIENKAKMPNIKAGCRNAKEPASKSEVNPAGQTEKESPLPLAS